MNTRGRKPQVTSNIILNIINKIVVLGNPRAPKPSKAYLFKINTDFLQLLHVKYVSDFSLC